MVRKFLKGVEKYLDRATFDQVNKAVERSSQTVETHGNKKEVVVAFVGLLTVVLFGTFVYAWMESMAFVDALYFTVVTATTVGFGDCKYLST